MRIRCDTTQSTPNTTYSFTANSGPDSIQPNSIC
jgi:hypothetical protein